MDTKSSMYNLFPRVTQRYDHRTSSTYRKVPGNPLACQPPAYRFVNNECIYDSGAGRPMRIKGILCLDKFSFPLQSIDNIAFGETRESTGIRFGPGQQISGVLGLCRSVDSFMSQIKDKSWRKVFLFISQSGKQCKRRNLFKVWQ